MAYENIDKFWLKNIARGRPNSLKSFIAGGTYVTCMTSPGSTVVSYKYKK